MFVAIEKYFKITDSLSIVTNEYDDFSNNLENFVSNKNFIFSENQNITLYFQFKTIKPYMENSYFQYIELLLDGTVEILIPQAEDMIIASVTLYNDVLSDIPVVMDYKITVNTVIDHLAIVETYIDLVNNEIKVNILFWIREVELFLESRDIWW